MRLTMVVEDLVVGPLSVISETYMHEKQLFANTDKIYMNQP